MNNRMIHIVKIGIISAALLTISGCGFDPKDLVHSRAQPQNETTEDGITWMAMKVVGEEDEWEYVPAQIALVFGYTSNQSTDIDVSIESKTFRIRKTGDSYQYLGPGDLYLTIDPILAAGLGGLVVLIPTFFLILSLLTKLQEQQPLIERAENAESVLRKLESETKTIQDGLIREQRQLAKKQTQLESWAEESQNEIDAARKAFELQKQIQIRAAQAVKRKSPTHEEWEEISDAVRAEQFRGSHSNREIAVQYCLDPKRSGSIVIEFSIVTTLPSPTLVVLRDGTEIHRQAGNYNGRFTCLFRKSAQRYKFEFKVFNGQRAYPDPLLIELTQPTFRAWSEPTKAPEKGSKEAWIANQVAHFKKLDRWPADETARKELLAKLEAEALERFGEAE